jgi:hypothetical protein
VIERGRKREEGYHKFSTDTDCENLKSTGNDTSISSPTSGISGTGKK